MMKTKRNLTPTGIFLTAILIWGIAPFLTADTAANNPDADPQAASSDNVSPETPDGVSTDASAPKRLRRADSFFGLHLDFHCGMSDKNVGGQTTPEMVNGLIDLVNPDFIQIDCKGHPGVSSYPTKVGNHGGSFVGDPMRVWRDITAKRGVALYTHYSGVWDNRAVELHPEWANVNADGSKSDRITSNFGGYVDSLLIPQLTELAVEYGVDGVWVDGDCWAIAPDYGEAAKKAFTDATGITEIPTGAADPNWSAWLEFHRDAFRNRLRHWVGAVKKEAPDFQIASNWAFTDHMPEPVSADVDYLSGDYSPDNSVNTARRSARYIETQGMPWDLMAWSFSKDSNGQYCQKSAVQIEREAACVLSQGGGFQAYYTQRRDGSVDLEKVAPMKEVSRFCRERKDFCFRSTAVPQTALIFPTKAHYHSVDQNLGGALFPMSLDWQRGIVAAMLENQYSVEIYNDETFESRIWDYPAVVLCQWGELRPEFKKLLLDYVRHGGGLLLIGEMTNALFADDFKEVAFTPSPLDPVLTFGTLGKGRIVEINRCLSNEYAQNPTPEIRALVGEAMKGVLPNPAVTVKGSGDVDVSLRRLVDGRLSVHLVNASGPHATESFFDDIKPLGPLTVTVKAARKPSSVTLEPGGRTVDYAYENGVVTATVDSVGIYDILVLDDRDHRTDWMAGGWGLFSHFLPPTPELTERYDVQAVADQIASTGAKWFFITMYQNSLAFNAPNAEFDRVTGYLPGERCAKRDLILDLSNELASRGIRLGVYLTGQVPFRDGRAQEAFGLGAKVDNRPFSIEFAEKWGKVFQEWSDRYGDRVSAWWIDGCYGEIGFNEEIAEIYDRALHHGNPNAIIAFNPGVKRREWQTSGFAAGEINEPFVEEINNRLSPDGIQNQILTYFGSNWGGRETRFEDVAWIDWIRDYCGHGGGVTIDIGPNFDPATGPVGTFSDDQLRQARAVGKAMAQ